MEKSQVSEWYRGQHIFITGATGFMGEFLVEKLLRSCSNLAALYIVVRPKKGKDPKERIEEYLRSPLFNLLKSTKNSDELLKKLHIVEGDVTKKDCGISDNIMQTLRNQITIVFHSAANVRFDMAIKQAINMNLVGTMNVLDLACKFSKLKVFVHVSTAYCHCNEAVLEEKLYKAPHNPRKMIELVNWLDDECLKVLTPQLIGQLPNTYAYTKCLAEELISEYRDRLPLVITRPSVVLASYKDPIPGFVDNINGPTGILIGGAKGVLRTMHGYGSYNADIIPVDMADNAIILIAWKEGKEPKKNEVQVYNVTAKQDNILTWATFLDLCKRIGIKYPPSQVLWYPGGDMTTSAIVYEIRYFLFHTIPAHIIDFLLKLTNNKPFMVDIQKRLRIGLKMLTYYTTRNWVFVSDKLTHMYNSLNDIDRDIFYTNRDKIDWEYYVDIYAKNGRTYCMKESPESLPQARKSLQRLYYLDQLTRIIFYLLLFYILCTCFITMFI